MIVVRGYAGRSTIVQRALEFLDIAEDNDEPLNEVRRYRQQVRDLEDAATQGIFRIYLTPRLDRYLDFHRSCLVGWRLEANTQRQDVVTVWLRAYDKRKRLPIRYRVVDEAIIGPSSAVYLGGELLDDLLSQPAEQSSAWGSVTGSTLGNKRFTAPFCTP